jgi:hypothetical protein
MKRSYAVDALRGLAMVLVILQHAYLNRNPATMPPFVDLAVWATTYMAAIAFMAISGAMFSYALSVQSWRISYPRYCKRALFLLLAVHPAINLTDSWFRLAGVAPSDWVRAAAQRLLPDFPITDTIAVCILVGPPLILGLRGLARAGLVTAMLVATVVARVTATSLSPPASLVVEALFGSLHLPEVFWFPLVPWLAIFLSGSFLGQQLAQLKDGRLTAPDLVRRLQVAGTLLAVGSVCLTGGYVVAKALCRDVWSPAVFIGLYPRQTTTLLPGYLAMQCWALAALLTRLTIKKTLDRFVWLLMILGRTSLFTYVVQFLIVESLPAVLGLKGTLGVRGVFALFVVGLAVMLLLSYSYGRCRGWLRGSDFRTTQWALAGERSRPEEA